MNRNFYLAAIAVILTSSCSKPNKEEVEAPAPVQVTAVTQDTIRRVAVGDGVLFPRDQASVTPKIAAPVRKFFVNRGDFVKQGQLLAELENRDIAAAAEEGQGGVEQAESNLRATRGAAIPEATVKAKTDVDAARQSLDAAKKVLDSRQDLFRQGALARRQVDEAQVAWAQANGQFLAAEEHLRALVAVAKDEQIKTAAAQVAAARSHYQSLQAQVTYSRILSPISGVVADRPLYAGELASPGTPLLTVVDISRVVARVNVPLKQAAIVRAGQSAILTLQDSKEPLEGKVTVVSPEALAEFEALNVTMIHREFRSYDVESQALVFAATNRREVNAEVARCAAARGIPVNVADAPEECSFLVPARVQRGDLQIAISTSGEDPRLAKKLRIQLEALLEQAEQEQSGEDRSS